MTIKTAEQIFEAHGGENCVTAANLIRAAASLLSMPGPAVADLITLIPAEKWEGVTTVTDAIKLITSENTRITLEVLDQVAGREEDLPQVSVSCLLDISEHIKQEAKERAQKMQFDAIQPYPGTHLH